MKPYKPRRRRKRLGIVKPKERLKRKVTRRKNKVKLKRQRKQYYRRNKSQIKHRRKRSSRIKVRGPAHKKNVRYSYS